MAGLSASMLQNDRKASMEIIKNMLATTNFSRISVLNKDGKIVMTSEPSLAGKVLDKNTDATCLICHESSATQRRSTAVITDGNQSYIRTTIAIDNKPACYGCHSKEKNIVGILFVDSSLDATNALLKEMTLRILLTAISVFLLGIFLVNFIVTHFLTKPLNALQTGFEKVGRGNFNYWVDVDCGGEISDMADSFNIMSRAIGRYVDEVKAKNTEVSTLYSIVQKISLTIEKKKLQEIMADLLCEVLQLDSVTLALPIEKQKNIFQILTKKTDDKRFYHSHVNINSDIPMSCLLTREDLLRWGEQDVTSFSFSNNGSNLLLSLQLKKMKVALISAQKPAGKKFSLSQQKFIPVLAHHMTISFANAQLYEMAITDELTALYTKRHFHNEIRRFEEEYLVKEKGFCVMMIDLDHFKEVNDTYGHPVGDLVLAQIGALLITNTRHGDVACRYGGEEFVVLLRGGDSCEAGKIAERVRKAVEEYVFTINEIHPFRKTISIGLACCPLHFGTVNEIIVAADTALYTAKSRGRNQVVMHTSPRMTD
ncbi:MAG: diguanylate cyclase [Proteobacteria bacterium]|nr:diguanylate cyclase [Pseudomonadota bacterium]